MALYFLVSLWLLIDVQFASGLTTKLINNISSNTVTTEIPSTIIFNDTTAETILHFDIYSSDIVTLTGESSTLPDNLTHTTTTAETASEGTTNYIDDIYTSDIVTITTKSSSTIPITSESSTIPITTESSTTIPITNESSTTIPITNESSSTIPITTESSSTIPITTKSSTTIPITSESSTIPITTESSTTIPITNESSTTIPITNESSTTIPITTEDECKTTTTTENPDENEKLTKFRNKLDELFDQTMILCNSFVKTKNNTIGELTINLTENYVDISRKYLNSVQSKNKCKTNTTSENKDEDEDEDEDIKEYKEKLEIVEIVSNELGKMFTNNTDYFENYEEFQNSSNVIEELVFLFDELYKVVKLKKRIKELEILEQEQFGIYKESQKIGDLNNDINTLTKIIKIQNEMINIIKNSNSMKYLYEDEYKSKSNVMLLVNSSNMEGKLKDFEEMLTDQNDELKIEEALIQLDNFIRPIVLGTIFLIGIIGNGVLLLVFIFNKDMRSAPNVMVINLNISDILGLTVNILMFIIETQVTDWTLGGVLCKLYRFSRFLTLGLSVYSIVVISVQRFFALTDMHRVGTQRCAFFGKYQPLMNVIFVWILASAFASVRGIKANVLRLRCWSGSPSDKQFFNKLMYVDFAIYFAIPFIIIAVTYGASSWRLKYSVKHMPGEAVGQEKALKARVLSSNVFLALIIVFAVCYMPYFLFTIYTRHFKINAPFMTVKYITFGMYCLIHSNASFNPIALYLASSKYREYMRIYLCYGYRIRKLSTETSAESNITIETRL